MNRGGTSPRPAAVAVPEHGVSVFINCPFDGAYGEFMDAIIFTVVACGYEPRSAVDTDETADSRMKRIVDALSGSHLSIHDLSRIYADETSGVAHMNMPLELGIAIALKLAFDSRASRTPHSWTALVKDGTAYNRAVSDLNGYDLKRYSSRETLVAQLMKWLGPRLKGRRVQFKPVNVVDAIKSFDEELLSLRNDHYNVQPDWSDIVAAAKRVAAAHRLQVLADASAQGSSA